MVFTISCSGDKGARGPAGIDGRSCTTEAMPNPAQGWVIKCEDGTVGNIYNGKNADGSLPGDDAPTCSVASAPIPGYAFSLNCGGTVVNIPFASSGGGGGGGGNCSVSQANEYNPFWLVMNCGSTVNVCLNGGAFDPEDYVCTNGAKRTVDINRDYYNRGGYFSDIDLATVLYSSSSAYISVNSDAQTSTLVTNSSSSYYAIGGGKENLFPSITSGILLPKSAFICNEDIGNVSRSDPKTNTYYDPNKQFCYAANAPAYRNGDGNPYKLKDLCGANDFLATKKFCFESKTGFKIVVSLCGGNANGTGGSPFLYNQFCQTERIARADDIAASGSTSIITGFQPYNHTTSAVMSLCGSNDWTGKIVTGYNDEIITYNAGKYYNSWLPTNAIVGSVPEYGKYFEHDIGFTSPSGTIDGGKQICDTDGIVKTQCGIPTTNPVGSSPTWVNNKILLFDARTQFCRDDIKFNPNDNSNGAYTQRVEVVSLCRKTDSTYANNRGGSPFDSKDYFCDNSDGKVKRKCLETFYDERTQFCFKEGNTPIAVGNKCRVNPLSTGATVDYINAQYDPRKQFCTIKIKALPAQGTSTNPLPAGTTLQLLNGQIEGGVNVGSIWVNATSSVVLQTNYTTNTFPSAFLSPNDGIGGTRDYVYEEVPEDMCQTSIKYNSGNWLWQSCLVTNIQDRTKDRYLHCGIGERPKEDFSGCEKIPAIPSIVCSATQVVFWNNTCKADCSTTGSGGTSINGATGAAGGSCSCSTGYSINSTTSPTACGVYGHATVATCEYSTGNIWPAYKGTGVTACEAANTCAIAKGLSLGTGNNAKVCDCRATGYTNWNATNDRCEDSDGCPVGYDDDGSGTCKDEHGCTESETWDSTGSTCI